MKIIIQHKIDAMDGLLRSQKYLEDQIREKEEIIREIDADLQFGAVKSLNYEDEPSHRSPGDSVHATLILEKTELEEDLKILKDKFSEIDRIYNDCSDEERELLTYRYVDGLTLKQISKRLPMSTDTVRRTIDHILAEVKMRCL